VPALILNRLNHDNPAPPTSWNFSLASTRHVFYGYLRYYKSRTLEQKLKEFVEKLSVHESGPNRLNERITYSSRMPTSFTLPFALTVI
jgi:hypothetical protein